MNDLFGPNADLMAKVMDLRLERQNLVMSNLANINVPGYKTRSMDFEKDLQDAVDTRRFQDSMPRPGSGVAAAKFDPAAYESEVMAAYKPTVVDGVDAVDLDKQMSVMAKNSLMYNALTTVMKTNFTDITKVIQDGGK